MMKESEPIGEAFTRNNLVVSLHHALALEVRGIKVELRFTLRRKAL